MAGMSHRLVSGALCGLAFAMSLLLVAGCASTSGSAPSAPKPAPAAPEKSQTPPLEEASLEVAIISRTGAYWPFFVAEKRGFFDRQKLKVEFVYTDQAARAAQVLAAGSVEFAVPSPDVIVTASEKGGNLVIVGGNLNKLTYSFMVQPEIKSLQDLKGKTFGVTALKGGNSVVMRRMMDHYGFKKEGEDYFLQVVGATPQAVAALKAKVIDGALVYQPQDFQVMEDGFTRIALSSEVIPKYVFNAIAARRDWAQQNKDVAARFLRAMIDAEKWLYDPRNKDEAVRILVQVSNIKEEFVRKTYELHLEQVQVFAKEGEVDLEGMTPVLEALADQGDLPRPIPAPTKYVDSSYVEAARKLPAP